MKSNRQNRKIIKQQKNTNINKQTIVETNHKDVIRHSTLNNRTSTTFFYDENDQVDVTTRYWSYLFNNLDQSIKYLYQTCENEQNIIKCKVNFFMITKFIY